MRTKDTAAMREVFHAEARLFGVRRRNTGEEVLQVTPWERFAGAVASNTRGEWIERTFSPEVRIRGPLATIWTEYDFHLGTTPSHCGIDAIQLMKTAQGWRIVSIADTFETTGCPRRDPPG
jgi:hypothetical protein